MGESRSSDWMAFEQAKDQSNLELARRNSDQSERYDKFGRERRAIPEPEGVYADSSMALKIASRVKKGNQPIALFTDIDNTFYRQEEAELSGKLASILDENKWGLVYVTGRDLPAVEGQDDLPQADIVVASVGTEIFVKKPDGTYEQDSGYRKLLLGTWDRAEVYKVAQQLVNENEALEFQPRDVSGTFVREGAGQEPQEFKISFNISGDQKTADQICALVEERISGARVVLSQDIHKENWWNLDLLPIHAGKELAVRHLTEKLGLIGHVGGDSGNDISMLVDSGLPAILVGNAHEHVKAEVVGLEMMPTSSGMQVRRLENGCKIACGREKVDEAAAGLINALQQGDLNPEEAQWFIHSLICLSERDKR